MLAVRRAGGVRFPWLQFYAKGHECGFRFAESNLLRTVAVAHRLENPLSLFWSVRSLDRCMRATIRPALADDSITEPETLSFVTKLFDLRHRVEFDQPKYKLGLTSTRSVGVGQTLKLTMGDGGVYVSKVVANTRKQLTITAPSGQGAPSAPSLHGQKLRVFFWRKDDAGYYFESKIVGEHDDPRLPVVHLAHSDNLIRAQKRRSVRRAASIPAQLFALRSPDVVDERVEPGAGFKCRLIDISEDGVALLVGGRAKAGLSVKVQVPRGAHTLILCGTIRAVSYKERNHASILHIEAQPPSALMRVRILAFVYGLDDSVLDEPTSNHVTPDDEDGTERAPSGRQPESAVDGQSPMADANSGMDEQE